jgi:xanthine dehydrogenase YagS FAD-binding subunit
VDLRDLTQAGVHAEPEGLVLGALARLGEVADHCEVRSRWPLIAAAIDASASAQVRNLATIGGNLLQRTRCAYFRSRDLPCNRRQPGSGCGALEGVHRLAAIFGVSQHCVATHASDLAVALVALDATILIVGPQGERHLAIGDLWRLPEDAPHLETTLGPGEIILSVSVPAATSTSAYRKVRDRASFEFAVVSVAALLTVVDGRIAHARVVGGGVGTVPWRLLACERALLDRPACATTLQAAAALASDGATPLRDNSFKIELLRRTALRALEGALNG